MVGEAGERDTDGPTNSPAGALSLGVKRAETLLEAARAVLGHTQDDGHAEQASVGLLPSQLQRSLDEVANGPSHELADGSSWLLHDRLRRVNVLGRGRGGTIPVCGGPALDLQFVLVDEVESQVEGGERPILTQRLGQR